MTSQEIISKFTSNHSEFIQFILALDNKSFLLPPAQDKWSAAQQADHIKRALEPLGWLLKLPKWLIRLITKKANRPSKDYDKLIVKYLQRLEKGGRASGRFIPARSGTIDQTTVTGKIEKLVRGICRSLEKFSEKDLDSIVLPHPLLGKLTLREMMFFTLYHVEHHLAITKKNLQNVY